MDWILFGIFVVLMFSGVPLPAVNMFFDKVLVMAEDKKLQENRLGLLQRIVGLSDGVADRSRLEGF